MTELGRRKNTAPVLDDADVLINQNGSFSYQASAFDPDPKEKLRFSFLIDGEPTQKFKTEDGVVFKIDRQTGEVVTKSPIPFDPDALYTLTIAVEDRFGATDVATARMFYFPPCFPRSIDVGTSTTSVEFDATLAPFCFTDNADVTTNAVITGFSSNDEIKVSGATQADYSFTTAADDVRDLVIVFNNLPTSFNQIVLDNVLAPDAPLIFDYTTAAAAVGFDFMTFA